MMALTTPLDPSLDGVRRRLQPPARPGSSLAALGAAALAAASALALAGAVILGPPAAVRPAPAVSAPGP